MDTVELVLNEEQAEELHRLLTQTLGDLSSEIAATDNPAFRRISARTAGEAQSDPD